MACPIFPFCSQFVTKGCEYITDFALLCNCIHNIALCCSGKTQTIFGFCMFSVLMMTVLVVSVAVAVNAITSTVSGIMLRKSHQIKYIEAVSFLKSSQRVLRCGMGC